MRLQKRQRVFIIPTISGLLLGIGCFGLFFFSFLYGYGPTYILSVVLITFFLAIGFLSNNNLKDIKLSSISKDIFEAEKLSSTAITIENYGKEVKLNLKIKQDYESLAFNVGDNHSTRIVTRIKMDSRGVYNGLKIRLFSRYPLGLFYCWRIFKIDIPIYVYPRPVTVSLQSHDSEKKSYLDIKQTRRHTSQEYDDIRKYQDGDQVSRIDWKRFAKSETLVVRTNNSSSEKIIHIDWNDFPEENPQLRLAKMCYLILECTRKNKFYKMSLPNWSSKVSFGKQHELSLLKKIAEFEEVVND